MVRVEAAPIIIYFYFYFPRLVGIEYILKYRRMMNVCNYAVYRLCRISVVAYRDRIIKVCNNNNNIYYIVLFARATIDDPFIRTIEVM